MDNLEEMDKFLEKYNFPKLNQEEIGDLNRPITSMEIKIVIRNLPANHIRNQKRNQNMHRNEWKRKHNNPKPVGHWKISAKGKVHSNTGIPQETRKSQINNLTLLLNQLEKEEMKNPRVSRRKEILKIKAEINAKQKRP